IHPEDWRETLDLKLQMAAKRLAKGGASDFENLWDARRSQGEGSYYPRFDDTTRTLDFNRPVTETMRIIRAFGLVECIAPMRDSQVYVRRASAWQESHNYTAGEVVH